MELRWVIRYGMKILQYSKYVYNPNTSKNEIYWANVPMVEFNEGENE